MGSESFSDIFCVTGSVLVFLVAVMFFLIATAGDKSEEQVFFLCSIFSIVLCGVFYSQIGLYQTHIKEVDGAWHACRRENGQIMCRPTESKTLINENGEVFECRYVDEEMMCVFKDRVKPELMKPELVTPDESR